MYSSKFTVPALLSPTTPITPTLPTLIKVAFDRKRVFELAKKLSDENRFFFQFISSSQFRSRFAIACEKMTNNLTVLESLSTVFTNQMSKFDFDETHPGNGYRSVAAVLDSCVLNVIRLLKDIKQMRHNLLFRVNHFCKELEAYGSVLEVLRRDLDYVKDYVEFWNGGELFPPEHARSKLIALMNLIESNDHSCFYGRCMGFQFVSSMFPIFQVVGVTLASYSMVWEQKGVCEPTWSAAATSLMHSGRFIMKPEERARRIAHIITNADISFCKSFWNLLEAPYVQDVPKYFCPNLDISEVYNIPCEQPLFIQTTCGDQVKISQPSAHTGQRPLPVRIITYRLKEEMTWIAKRSQEVVSPKSPCLLFHCHGGGYVAGTPRSHEIYLRHWAKLLDCTIVSLDYSLAPDNPYPRAFEECLYAYAWVLSNVKRLGWTGERLCFAGDSAGGHLLMTTTLRAIEMGVARLPDGLVMIYTPFLIEYNPSPSRLLSFMDPLLPPGITARCIAAYIGEPESSTTKLNGASNMRSKLTEYAMNLKKETSENRSAMSSMSSPTSDEKKVNEIINFCLINKPSPPSNSREYSPTSKTNDNSSEGSSTRWDKPKIVANRQRSHSDPLFDLSSLAEEDDYYEESTPIIEPLTSENSEIGSSNEMTTVKIERDPNRIFLTSSAYDQDFITYLSEHELTRKSCVRLRIPSPFQLGMKQDILLEGSVFSSSPSLDEPLSAKIHRVENPRLNSRSRSYSTGSLSAMSSTIGTKLSTMTGYLVDGISRFLEKPSSDSSAGSDKATESVSCLSQFHDLKVPKDPFLSPLYADDEMIAKLPPVSFVAGHLDPLLDDTIAFAKKLQRNKVKITLDLLDALPHGFLNFTLWSPDCRDGAKVCLQRIRDRLNLDNE